MHIDTVVFIATVVPIGVCVCLCLYCVTTPIWNPKSPYRTPFLGFIRYLFRKLRHIPYNRLRGRVAKLASMEVHQEESAMKETEDRKKRDVRAVQWLVRHLQ
jgi:hypothetical protein